MIGPQFARLLTPVPAKMVRTVDKGKKGKFSYLGTTDVRQLLIYHLGAPYGWRVHILFPTGNQTPSGEPAEDAFVCVGDLSVSLDGEKVTVSGVGTGNSAKAAASDALKRAAREVGVGMSLYGGFWLANQLAKDGHPLNHSAVEVSRPTDDDDDSDDGSGYH